MIVERRPNEIQCVKRGDLPSDQLAFAPIPALRRHPPTKLSVRRVLLGHIRMAVLSMEGDEPVEHYIP